MTFHALARKDAVKVLEVVDEGLVFGLGRPEPGYMCVEAAVCYALGLPHGDCPPCVNPALRRLKIILNDMYGWKSTAARAKGLRRLAIAQLGTDHGFNTTQFNDGLFKIHSTKLFARAKALTLKLIREPSVREEVEALKWKNIRSWGPPCTDKRLIPIFDLCYILYRYGSYGEIEVGEAITQIIRIARDKIGSRAIAQRELEMYAEDIVQLLVEMKTPGSQWLDLTKAPVF